MAALLVAGAACKGSAERQKPPAPSSSAPKAPAPSSSVDETASEIERGKALVEAFECWRCHSVGDDSSLFGAKDHKRECVGCHHWIEEGAMRDSARPPPPILARWQKNARVLRAVPSLTGAYQYQRRWLERFLLEPYDLRPNLTATMPRLAMTPAQAHDIASWIIAGTRPLEQTERRPDAGADLPADPLAGADRERGRGSMEQHKCSLCHVFSGVPPFTTKLADGIDGQAMVALAPDLRFTRDRLDARALIRWLENPKAIRPKGSMWMTSLTAGEARDIAAYLLRAELAPIEPPKMAARLPLLTRTIGYDEVAGKVLNKTCRHCHAEPDAALGDGGPGNTGGFGFAPRGVNLAEYEGVAAGGLDEYGERRSLFAKMDDGTPRLVRALLARQSEEAGRPDPQIRGMPLGLPALSPEEVQIVESWIAQGSPR